MNLERSWFSALSPTSELGCAPTARWSRVRRGTDRASALALAPSTERLTYSNVKLTLKTGRQNKQ